MKIYIAGGYCRDFLLGLEPKDKDYVVIGSTPEEMLSLGYKQVGKDFPVFLHPETGEEYSLARVDRKIGKGYYGFTTDYNPNITLKDDAFRRDLSINQIFMDPETNEIIDYFNGQEDLKNGILRHVSEAFAEDPIRTLRVCRFAARYDFKIHPDTLELMKKIVHELDYVPQERIWLEFEKGLKEKHFSRMYEELFNCNAFTTKALSKYSTYINNYHTNLNLLKTLELFGETNNVYINIKYKIAILCYYFKNDEDYDYCRIPNDISKLSKILNKYRMKIFLYDELEYEDKLDLLLELNAFRNKELILDSFKIAMLVGFRFQYSDNENKDIKVERDINLLIESNNSQEYKDIVNNEKDGNKIKELLYDLRLNLFKNIYY